jgi:UDP-N-acetylmuramoylalanine--D-glutamate ligase
MNIALIGYDTDGKSSYEYFAARGDRVTICDQNETLAVPEGASAQLGGHYLDNLDEFDLIVRTSGMPASKILEKNPDVAGKITTQINEFFAASPTRHIIGVTGTKGKGTTCTLITKMLLAAGKDARVGGNIGIPPLSFIGELTPESWVILELSSFQLSDIRYSPPIAVCLMVVPEHLNWHADMADYKTAKSRLFAQQTADDVAIYLASNPDTTEIASAGAGRKLPYYQQPGAWVNGTAVTIDGQEICTTDELKLLGKHNWQNVCAAVTAVWEAGIRDIAAMRSVLTSFSGLEYHIERIRELDGVQYYNDSFGTTPETAIVAMEAFSEPKIMIVGGSDKGVEFDGLAQAIAAQNVRHVVLIGNTAPSDGQLPTASLKIAAALEVQHFTNVTSLVRRGGPTMQEAVDTARAVAQAGDVVLLSTGCASFDMFPNYKARGAQFTETVNALS